MSENIMISLSDNQSEASVSVDKTEVASVTPAFQEKNCCICNRSIDDRYSVLLKAKNNAEGRICMSCREALHELYKCENIEKVKTAGNYIASYYLSVSPVVLPYLDYYLQKGSEYIHNNRPQIY